jgi:hypothetical protein
LDRQGLMRPMDRLVPWLQMGLQGLTLQWGLMDLMPQLGPKLRMGLWGQTGQMDPYRRLRQNSTQSLFRQPEWILRRELRGL